MTSSAAFTPPPNPSSPVESSSNPEKRSEAQDALEKRKDSPNAFARVHCFNHEVVKIGERKLQPLVLPEANWLRTAVEEESKEMIESFQAEDLEERLVAQVDACIDLAIFSLGGLARMGLNSDQMLECFHAVMDANFEKRAGVKPGREGAPDAVKPEGWVGPEQRIKEILNRG